MILDLENFRGGSVKKAPFILENWCLNEPPNEEEQDHRKWYFLKEPLTTLQDCCGVIPVISSHFWEYPKYRVIPDISGYPLLDDFQN